MQPVIHFLGSIVAGIGVGLHMENRVKKYLVITTLAFMVTCIDLDHALPIYHETGIKIFHNIFVFVFLPVSLLIIFHIIDNKKDTTIRQRVFIILCVMTIGHMVLDLSAKSTIQLYYPITQDSFIMSNMGITMDPCYLSLYSEQVMFIIWGFIIFWGNLFETITYNSVENKKMFEISSQRITSKFSAQKNKVLTTIEVLFNPRHRDNHYYGSSVVFSKKEENYTFEAAAFDNMFDYIQDLQGRR